MVRVQQGPISVNGRQFPPGGGDVSLYTVEQNMQTDTESLTNYTLVFTDLGKVVELNKSGANTLTIPNDTTVNFPYKPDTVIEIFQLGVGQVTVQGADAGVNIRSAPGITGSRALVGQYATATLRKRAANSWMLSGELVAV